LGGSALAALGVVRIQPGVPKEHTLPNAEAQEETRKYNELVQQQMNDLEHKEAAQEANPATRLPGLRASAGFFHVLGVKPYLGCLASRQP